MALILQHPKATVQFDPPYTPESVAAAKAAMEAEREAAGFPKDYFDAREQPVSPPLHRALTGIAEPDICTACGLANRLHIGSAGGWLGCEVARFTHFGSRRPAHVERWNDPRPHLTAAVRAAMVDGSCGPELEVFMAGITNDDQLAMAMKLGQVAVSAYLKEIAK